MENFNVTPAPITGARVVTFAKPDEPPEPDLAAAVRIKRLTPRENEVLHALIGGASNLSMSRFFGLSPRTIENHRNEVMQKLGVHNVADLLRLIFGIKWIEGRWTVDTSAFAELEPV